MKKLKVLIVVRHADYDYSSGHITNFGRENMDSLGLMLRKALGAQKSIRMLSSTAPRAIDTSDVLARNLELDGYIQEEVLWSDEDHRARYRQVVSLVEQHADGVDVLIVVTHLEHGEHLPAYYWKKGMTGSIRALSKGEAAVLDFVNNRASIMDGL